MPKLAALATHLRLPDHSCAPRHLDVSGCAGTKSTRVVFEVLFPPRFFVEVCSRGEPFAMRIFPTSVSGTRSSSSSSVRRAVVIALVLAVLAGVAHAQAPAPPPGPPPLTQPSVPILPGMPSQLTSVPGVVATPLATPVTIPTMQPTPAPRLFNCSCFTNASGTQWAGTVTASSYSQAASAAAGACAAYLTSTPQSPYITPGQSPGLSGLDTSSSNGTSSSGSTSSSSSSSTVPGTGASNSPVTALKNSPTQTGQGICTVCACN